MEMSEDDSAKVKILVCGQTSGFYVAWSSLEKSLLQIEKKPHLEMKVGNFYEIQSLSNGIVSTKLIESPLEVNVIFFPSMRSIVVAKAPIFIGNQYPGTKQYIGYSDFFGRVFLDASYTALKVEQFKTYLCTLRIVSKKNHGCSWKVEQVIRADTSLKYYLLEAKVEHQEEDMIFCVKDNLKVKVQREDLRQHCYDDLFSLLSIYLIVFKNEPNNLNCDQYNCCFATLLDDFSNELSQKALVPRESTQCCDVRAVDRILVLTELMHNAEFLEKCLNKDLKLKERLFSLMIGESGEKSSSQSIKLEL